MKITIAQQNYTIADIKGNTAKIIDAIRQTDSPITIFPEGAITGLPVLDLNLESEVAQSLEIIAKETTNREVFIGLELFQIAYLSDGKVQIVDSNSIRLDDAIIFFEAEHFSHSKPRQRLREMKEIAVEQKTTVIKINQVGASTDTIYHGGSSVCYLSGETITLPLWQECVRTIDTSIPANSTSFTTRSANAVIDTSCTSPTIDTSCTPPTIDTSCTSPTIDTSCTPPTIDTSCTPPTIDTSCTSPTIDTSCTPPTIDTSCTPPTIDTSTPKNAAINSSHTQTDTSIPANATSDWDSEIEQTHQAILLAIRDYFHKNGFSEACIALSGGIDSAIVVALTVEALGADRVRVLMLPTAYSSDHSISDSLEMIRRCGIRHETINIEPIFQEALTAMEPIFKGTKQGTAEENIQSRIRLMLMMALSNKTGALMLNTSNKSEVAVGYGTLYGDTSGALGIIADLYKTQVYELANHINKIGGNLIPRNIIDKEPSAELRHNQKDTDSLLPYDILDAILFRMIEKRMGVEEIIADGFLSEDVIRTARLLWNGDFKRKQLPPAIRLSGTTLSVEYQMPITKISFDKL